jgi:hypothetical protein
MEVLRGRLVAFEHEVYDRMARVLEEERVRGNIKRMKCPSFLSSSIICNLLFIHQSTIV